MIEEQVDKFNQCSYLFMTSNGLHSSPWVQLLWPPVFLLPEYLNIPGEESVGGGSGREKERGQ